MTARIEAPVWEQARCAFAVATPGSSGFLGTDPESDAPVVPRVGDEALLRVECTVQTLQQPVDPSH
jgi:hypothetical protein